MGLINIIIACLLIAAVIMTFVTEPKISFDYYKAMGVSMVKIVGKIKDIIVGFIGGISNGEEQSG